ncbi:rab9 effector protein with kelch motifs-like [Branchiostoma lanceolatum]|uniref:rab9 effector protein with kelch motifs-like n=1 Tax=Branchiostoma lanceolatum TaxID=7740 RepID=UPI00345353A4
MELHPILELPLTDPPAPGMWYVLSAGGVGPSLTVGHTCTYLPRAGGSGKVVLVGGANPSGPFADTFVLDLEKYTWEKPEWAGLTARYEHTCFTPESQPHKVFVFGGAEQGRNLNNIQVLDTETGTWTTADVQGTPPSPRTCHYTPHRGDRLYVWGGGKTGAEPTEDRKLHVFDAATLTWSQPQLEGKPPKPRHGHVMVAVGNKLYVHGGMSGVTFYDDLYVLNMDTKKWKRLKPKGPVPSARAAHTAVVHGTQVYMFGGMNQDGAMDSMHVLNTETLTWSELSPEGPPPAPRLDHAACIIHLSVGGRDGEGARGAGDSDSASQNPGQDAPSLTDCSSGEGTEEQNTGAENLAGAAKRTETMATEPVVSSSEKSSQSENAEEIPCAEEAINQQTILDVTEQFLPEEAVSKVAAAQGHTAASEEHAGIGPVHDGKVTMLLVYGGMDTQGVIHEDCLVMRIA